MRAMPCLAAAVAVCATSTATGAKTPAAPSFEIKGTAWVLTGNDGVKIRETVDPKGNYVANTIRGKHIDHGTAVMKGRKACFTSAMNKEGEVCWTTSVVKIGQVMRTTSDKGEEQVVTRVEYVPVPMPK